MMIRRLFFALFTGLLAAPPASALTLAVKQALGPPGWVLPYQPSIQFGFARGTAWKGTGTGGGAVIPTESLVVVARTSVDMIDDLAGLWREIPANVLSRSNKGMVNWGAGTNLALWCRDLTNAAWAKVNMTTALTATGIDGAANSATTITATGASATILQTVVQASTADTVSFFVRRRTGTGTVEITPDGVAFTDITAALATAATATPGGWYRATVSATLVNPVLGVRITTSGDAVDVDFAQLEAGTFATSPILTTTASATRAVSTVNLSGIAFPFPAAAISGLIVGAPASPTAFTTTQLPMQIDDGTNNNRLVLQRTASTGTARALSVSNAVTTTLTGAAWSQNTAGKLFAATQASDQALIFNAAAAVTGAGAAPLGSISRVFFASSWNGLTTAAAVWPTRLSNAIGTSLTLP